MEKATTWAGLDVHAERIVIATFEGQTKEPDVWDIPNEPKVIRRTFQRLAKASYELRCCYEAGPCGFELHRQLTVMGIACDVVAPSLIPVRVGDRVKTDRRDAQKLGRLYRAGELTAITVPSAEQEAVRDLVRARDDVRKDLTAARNRLGKFLIRHGHIFSNGKKWTLRFWAWLSKVTFERECERLTFEHYVAEVQHLVARRAALDSEIGRIAKTEPYATPVKKLVCLRGFSTLSAVALVAEESATSAVSRAPANSWPTSAWCLASTRAAARKSGEGSPRPETGTFDDSSSRRPGATGARQDWERESGRPTRANPPPSWSTRQRPRGDCTGATPAS